MANVPDRITTIASVNSLDNESESSRGENKPRIERSPFWFILIVLSFTLIPFVNLQLFFFPKYSLNKGTKINSPDEGYPADGADDYSNYYGVIGGYIVLISAFLFTSYLFYQSKETIRLYLLLDTMFIAEITSDISYISLHINYFGNDLFNNVYILVWQDYIVMILNVAANFAMVGAIRVLIVRMKWYPWQVVILKLFLLISSLLYVAIGIYYQATADSCTSAIQGLVNDSLDNIFNLNPVSQSRKVVMEIMSITQSYMFVNGMYNFVLLYVFANFAFLLEIFKKITDFDGTNEFRTDYVIQDQQDDDHQGQQYSESQKNS